MEKPPVDLAFQVRFTFEEKLGEYLMLLRENFLTLEQAKARISMEPALSLVSLSALAMACALYEAGALKGE